MLHVASTRQKYRVAHVCIFFSIIFVTVTLSHNVSAKIPSICSRNDGTYILKCPKTCASACSDVVFKNLLKNQKKCKKLRRIPVSRRYDGQGCMPPKKTRPKLTYPECKQKIDTHFKKFTKPKAPLGPLQTVFDNRPGCATPIKRLLARFVCLRDASKATSGGVAELTRAGLRGLDDSSKLCALKKVDFKYYTQLSTQLISQGDLLTDDFAELDACRKSLIGWTDKLKTACRNATFPNCDNVVTQLAKKRAPMMKGITNLSDKMRTQLSNVKRELDSIRFMESAALDCGLPQGEDIETIDLDTLLGN